MSSSISSLGKAVMTKYAIDIEFDNSEEELFSIKIFLIILISH